jgi:hypothetical protein
VAAQLGYCGLDRERRPLRGDEIRACWEASMAPTEVVPTPGERRPTMPLHVVEDRTPVRKLEFVEVRPARPTATTGARRRRANADPGVAADGPEAELSAEPLVPVTPGEPRWSLWSDAEI